jgi:hypothetical protein
MSNFIISKKISNIIINDIHVPDLPQSIILEFLGYKLRNGKFIFQLSNEILEKMNDLLLDRPEMIDGIFVSFDIDFRLYHNDYVVKTLEIEFCPNDRNKFRKRNHYYAIDYDETRYHYEPSVPW